MYIPNFGFESFEWVGLIVCRRDMALYISRDGMAHATNIRMTITVYTL